jgi:hypothetical protein
VNALDVKIAGGQTTFRPGEEVRGVASWSLEEPPERVELRLFWHTQGKGDQDVEIVERVPFDAPGPQDRREFVLRLPEGPYSFSGKLISLLWSIEVVAEPGDLAGGVEIVVSPHRREVVIGKRGEG